MSWRHILRQRSTLGALAVLLIVAVAWGGAMAAAARPATLDDRVNDVASQLQCLPCQGESVADSPSTWAAQIRATIRARLQRGESERQVVQYFVNHYGEGIRQEPPKSGFTLLIWLAPVFMLLVGLFVLVSVARQWRSTPPAAEATDPELEGVTETELEQYRAQLASELELPELAPRRAPGQADAGASSPRGAATQRIRPARRPGLEAR